MCKDEICNEKEAKKSDRKLLRKLGNRKTGKSNAIINRRKLVTQNIENSNRTVLLDQTYSVRKLESRLIRM